MKKLQIFGLILIILFVACKKQQKEPFGPTDVRILNLTDLTMNEVTVNTWDSTFNYGAIAAGDTSEYHRFNRAYVVADIAAMINGLQYKTDSAVYTWKNYVGKVKITYRIWIISDADRRLGMELIGYDAPLE